MSNIGKVYTYDNGRELVRFEWEGHGDGYAWSEKRKLRLAEYKTLRAVKRAFQASDNSDGPYGCAVLRLDEDDR